MISIIVPCYNEEAILEEFLDELETSTINLEYEFELILIDNNSSDSTWNILSNCKKKFAFIKLIKFSNYLIPFISNDYTK